MLSRADKRKKRAFDLFLSVIGIVATSWLMALAWLISSLETKSNGLFIQERIGKNSKPFNVYKIKTMKQVNGINTTVTTSFDSRITKSGAFFRKTKIDELPQLFNVLLGNMSFVGYRPDVRGFADELSGDDRTILDLPPGITGPASIKYKNEEELLSKQPDPEKYNQEVIWPDKVALSLEYMKEWSLTKDIGYIIRTIIG